jgi:asparagine synthase (glutamine-hydrolysing)
MSAIAGIVRFDGRPDAASDLDRMMRALADLGPDRQSAWQDGPAALGFRQMALLPEDAADRQPWQAHGGAAILVANGRLDNRDELGDALAIDNPLRRTMADSELLLRAYERWGLGCLDRLLGEFTFAVWDTRDRRLVCARCQVDGPPLYYHRSERFFAFATTPAALFALPDVPRALAERRLANQLGFVPGQIQDTYYRDIFCLPPAHHLDLADRRVTTARYWQLDRSRQIRLGSDKDYEAALRERFDQAVRARLRSVHPIGSMLSGGCDSSAVTATAAHMLAEDRKTLAAFTAAPREGYPPTAFGRPTDESRLAAELAAGLPNVRHHIVRPRGRTALDRLDQANPLFGCPIFTPANLVWYSDVLDTARQSRVRVLLNGNLGNSTISYTGMPRLAGLLRSGQWYRLAREALGLRRNGHASRQIARAAVGPLLPSAVARWRSRSATEADSAVAGFSAINPAFAAEMGLEAKALSRDRDLTLRPSSDGFAARQAMLALDDRGEYWNASLAGWGIEPRDPTSDRRVLEFCLAVPDEQYLRDGVTKSLFRRTFADRIPAAEIAARPRGYQGADWHEGLEAAREQIVTEIGRLEKSPGARRALDLPRLRRLVEDWPTGNWHSSAVTRKYRLMLLRAVAVGKFIRWVEGGNE